MTARPSVAADLGKHLISEMQILIDRHARLAEGGGASPTEWSAAMMIAVDRVILQGLAGIIIGVQPERRAEVLDAAMLKVASEMYHRRQDLMKVATVTDTIFRQGRTNSDA